MQTKGIRFAGTTICAMTMAVASVLAQSDTRTRSDKTSPPAGTTAVSAVPVDAAAVSDELPAGAYEVAPLPKGATVHRIYVDTQGHRLDASVAGTSGTLVYANDLGTSTFGPSGFLAQSQIGDDITTIAFSPDPDNPTCMLDHYVVRVTGDRGGTGQGVGDYTVNLALFESCPGVDRDDVIPGSEAQVTIRIGQDVATEADIAEIVVVPLTDIEIERIRYVSVRFSRDFCGVVVGAPARLGFSGDRFDFPGSPCQARIGIGFPAGPHASFGVDLYARGTCSISHPAYKNTNHNQGFLTPGPGKRFADNLRIGVPLCNLIGYEFAYKGNGVVEADLRTELSTTDPNFGNVIPGSRQAFFSSSLDGVQVGRVMLPDPFLLTSSSLFITFRTTSAQTGPVLTCLPALLGETPNLYQVFNETTMEWEPQTQQGTCNLGFDVTLFCEGQPPAGACCDMVLLDDQGEAVCRDGLPEMNCAFPQLWQQGDLCDGVCVGGNNDGAPCTRQADCDGGDCQGPFFDPCGLSACCKPQGAANEACENLTQNQCSAIEPVENPRLYQRGQFCNRLGQRCPKPACIGRDGDCFAPSDTFCVGGANDGQACNPNDPPFLSNCNAPICTGGACDGITCEVGQLGQPCSCPGSGGQPDPNSVCLNGNCLGRLGCEDPFCCDTVCNIDSFCCEVTWDATCANNAAQFCQAPPKNDECAPTDQAEGARLITLPTVVDANTMTATTNQFDPGFCCHTGIPGDPSSGPGDPAVNTVWFRFVAPTDSVFLSTCCSDARPGGDAKDSLVQVLEPVDQDRGICADGNPCSIAAQDCVDGSTCELDLEAACNSLVPVACNDDSDTCGCGGVDQPTRSQMCVTGLTPGNTYFILVGAKTDVPDDNGRTDTGIFALTVTPNCAGTPVLHNDRCQDAEVPAGQDDPANYPLTIPFDLTGATFGEAPVTFDCPGPPSFCLSTMENDVWYDWTAPCNGTATIDTCDGDNTPDTGLAVYRGCDCPVGNTSEDIVACSDFMPPPCFLGSMVQFDVEQGQCYKIRLGGHLGDQPAGPMHIDVACNPCPVGPVTFLDPQPDTVDARQPHPPGDPSSPQGIDTITVAGTQGTDSLECWSLCETADNGSPNSITGIDDNGDGTYTVHLARPITPGAFTTLSVTLVDSTVVSAQYLAHPGNVNGDGFAFPDDLTALIDVLNGTSTPAWGNYSVDIDHSGTVAAPDILRLIDVFQGADGYDFWLGSFAPFDCAPCCAQ